MVVNGQICPPTPTTQQGDEPTPCLKSEEVEGKKISTGMHRNEDDDDSGEEEVVAELVKQSEPTKRNFSVFSLSAKEDDSPLIQTIRISVTDKSTGENLNF